MSNFIKRVALRISNRVVNIHIIMRKAIGTRAPFDI